MNKWKKALTGTLLLAGFALYLQNEKSAEPVWKVNGKEFTVNEGATNHIPIPEENLTFTISDLVQSEPLSSPVIIKYKVPEIKK